MLFLLNYQLNLKNMIKNLMAVLAFTLLVAHNGISQSQEKSVKNANYVTSLLGTSTIAEVRIIAGPLQKVYSKEWTSSCTVKDGFLIFKKNDNQHSWDIENAVLIEKNNDVIFIHLSDRAE
jgi:hypothetical protein